MEISNHDKVYARARNCVYACQYHVIFTPKYRRPIFKNGLEEKVKEYFVQTSEKFGFEIIEQEVMPDHVHLLLSVNPDFGIKRAIARLKGFSAKMIGKEFPKVKKGMPCVWTNSKFVSTVGAVSLDVVRKYIEDQKNV